MKYIKEYIMSLYKPKKRFHIFLIFLFHPFLLLLFFLIIGYWNIHSTGYLHINYSVFPE